MYNCHKHTFQASTLTIPCTLSQVGPIVYVVYVPWTVHLESCEWLYGVWCSTRGSLIVAGVTNVSLSPNVIARLAVYDSFHGVLLTISVACSHFDWVSVSMRYILPENKPAKYWWTLHHTTPQFLSNNYKIPHLTLWRVSVCNSGTVCTHQAT